MLSSIQNSTHSVMYMTYDLNFFIFNVQAMCIPGKAVVSMPIGGPAMMNNYMIAQPPGFQLAAFVSITVLTCVRHFT